MKILLLAIGKTDEDYLITGIKKYVGRLGHYVSFEMKEIPDIRNRKTLSEEQQKTQEAELIKKQLQAGDYVVLLDEHGAERRSVDFATWLQKRMNAGSRRIVFIVGGPYGFDSAIHSLANEEISLSQMTFSHQLIRVLFIEQLYRACTILRGEPYHHE